MTQHSRSKHTRNPARVSLLLMLLLLALTNGKSAQAIPIATRAFMLRAIPRTPLVKPRQARHLLLIFNPTENPDDQPHLLQAMLSETLFFTKAASLQQSDDAHEFDNPAQLIKDFDAVIFINDASSLFTTKARRESLTNFLNQGKGIVFLHDGIRTADHWLELQLLIGAQAHHRLPVSAPADPIPTTINVVGNQHQLNQPIDATILTLNESILTLAPNSFSPVASRLLLAAQTNATLAAPASVMPVSWLRVLKNHHDARIFCSTLGSNTETYYHPGILAHWLAGLQFALGDLTADTRATANLPIPSDTLAENLERIATLTTDTNRNLRSAAATFIYAAQAAGPSAQADAEQALIQLLNSENATLIAKRFACQQLRSVGSAAALPHLLRQLENPDLINSAKSTLALMPPIPDLALDPAGTPLDEINQALSAIVRAPNQSSTRRAASLDILGRRQASALFEEAYTIVQNSDDPLLRRAAIRYVGKISPLKRMGHSREFVMQYLETDDEQDAAAYADALIDLFRPGNGMMAYGSIFTHNINADEIITPREAYRAGVIAKVIGGYRGSQMIYFMGASDDPAVWAVMENVLANWPDGMGHKAPFALAIQGKRKVNQEPLVRAFVRLMSKMQDYPPLRLATAFQQAFDLSHWDDVDLDILRFLAFVPDPVTLEVALKALETRTNPQTQAAALRVIVLISEKLQTTHQPESRAALTKALEFIEANDPDNAYRPRARELLKQLQ